MSEKGFFYANSAAIGFSAFDFTLVFQRRSLGAGITPVAGTERTEIVGEFDVVSSPGHTKMVAAALMDSILNYEQQYGPIKLNDSDATTFERVINRLMPPRSTKQ